MKHYSKNSTVVNGFTLIEVMLVIVLVGLMVSVVQFSASGDKAEETLELAFLILLLNMAC
jgi:general secretion pathway protein H